MGGFIRITNNKGAIMAAPLIKYGGSMAFKILRSLYKGGGFAKKKAISLSSKVSDPKIKQALQGAGKKLTSAGQHVRKHHKLYTTGVAAYHVGKTMNKNKYEV